MISATYTPSACLVTLLSFYSTPSFPPFPSSWVFSSVFVKKNVYVILISSSTIVLVLSFILSCFLSYLLLLINHTFDAFDSKDVYELGLQRQLC